MRSISDKSKKQSHPNPKTVVIHVSEGRSFDLQKPQPKVISQYVAINQEFSSCVYEEATEAKHERSIDNWLIKGQIINISIRQLFAFIIAMFGLYIAWDLGKSGNTVSASVIATIDLIGLARIFLGNISFKLRNRKRHNDNEAK